jgi:virulence-associated protein VapD
MEAWAITYDLDVMGMKCAKFTQSQAMHFYESTRKCLAHNNFSQVKQLNIFVGEGKNPLSDAFQLCIELRSIANAERFIHRLHLFRVEDFNDLMPLVTGRPSSGKDPIIEEIDAIFAPPCP